MKKIIVLTALSLFLAAPAFAAAVTLTTPAAGGTPTTATIGGGVFQCSTLVTLIYESSATAYTADSGHLNGDKGYSTTSLDSTIAQYDKGKGVAVAAVTVALSTVEANAEEVVEEEEAPTGGTN